MSRYIELLQRIRHGRPSIGFGTQPSTPPRSMVLAVSLPRNEIELARAAFEAGAEAVVVNVNIGESRGKGWATSLEAEGSAIAEILKLAADRPCGLAVAGASDHELGDLRTVEELGFDFLILTAQEAPLAFLQLQQVGKVLAVDQSYPDSLVRTANNMSIDALQLLTRAERAGNPLTIRNLMRLRHMALLTTKPTVFLPSEHLQPSDLALLAEAGIESLMLAEPTLGTSPQSLRRTITAFRTALDQLPPPGRQQKPGAGETVALLPASSQGPSVAEGEDNDDEAILSL
ncbi:MAG: hypothetical protein HYX89_04925 [Chloroflexi bacterium]|nr:hypothetical protein [Chloroflexota bacterium]